VWRARRTTSAATEPATARARVRRGRPATRPAELVRARHAPTPTETACAARAIRVRTMAR
jgi:hypothetical protein